MTVIRYIACLAVVFCLPSVVAGKSITVRSGAHDGFSRLVMQAPVGLEWRVAQTPQGAALRVPGYENGFDVSKVFDLIDRRHIESVVSTPNGLDIALSCNCSVNSFEVSGGFIVIDVSSNPEKEQAATPIDFDWPTPQRVLRLPGASVPTQIPSTNNSLTANDSPPVVAINRESTTRPQPALESLRSAAIDTLLQSLPEPEPDGTGVSAKELAKAQQKISKRVAIAATQGVLDPTRPSVNLSLQNNRPQIDTSIFDSSEPTVFTDLQGNDSGTANIRVTSSSDLPSQTLVNELESTSMGLQCIPEDNVAVGTWGTDVSPMAHISQLRADLFSETDRLEHDTALELSRLYLHYGFGAEAKQTLQLDPDLAAQNPELVAIAEIMEFGNAVSSDYLSQFADCNNSVALWAILAQPRLTPSSTIAADPALRALTGLPMHLRRFVAPKLSRSFLQYGDEASAATALRSIERTPEPLTAGAELARAELQMAKGETGAAQDTLARVVASNEQQSAEALIQFVDSHLEADTLIDQSVATLVEAYAVEMRDDPIGAELKRTHVLALAKSGQFDAAFDALGRIRLRDDGTIETELRTSLIDIASRTASDVVFLEHIFEHVDSERRLSSPRVGIAVAQRLANLGFASMAESVLVQQGDLPNTSRLKELRARLALDLGRPFEAEAILFGVDSETADRLRARAKRLDKNYSEASALYAELGNDAESTRSAWLAEDWDSIADEDSNPFAPIVDLIEAPLEDIDEPDGMKGRMSEAVSESARAREVIQSLLQTVLADEQP